VLTAGREVEDALAGVFEAQGQARSPGGGGKASGRSVGLGLARYKGGGGGFNRVFTTQAPLGTQPDQRATTRGNIALNLIAVYRALGGGWQLFEKDDTSGSCAPEHPAAPPDDTPRLLPVPGAKP